MHRFANRSVFSRAIYVILIDGQGLTIEQVADVANQEALVQLDPSAEARVHRARALVDSYAASGNAVYGINTGFGYLKNVRIENDQLDILQLNLIRSHAVGVGAPLSEAQTRALMVLRANVLATGRSGVHLETLTLLLDLLNHKIHPVIPCKGSVGASGDLAPLAHLALAMIGEGTVVYQGKEVPSIEALKAENLSPIRPGPKEGLCLVNGTQAMSALACLAIIEAENLCLEADIIGAASVEGRRGTATAFEALIHNSRPHPGQRESARHLRQLLASSQIAQSHEDCDSVQDPYSLRCMPQVHGAVRDVLQNVRRTVEIEINSATDNPLVFAEQNEGDRLISGGNFHGQPLAFAMDFLAIAVSELASISERRVEQLIDPALSGLPAFLLETSGLNSGFMMAQVTAASLVNENKVLCTPASVDSIPTSANQEDHVSMGMTSARKALEVIENTRFCLAIEMLCACQAIDLIKLKPGVGVQAAYDTLRSKVKELEEDRVLHQDIEAATELLARGEVRTAVSKALTNK